MKLAADASALVAEALRDRGRRFIRHPDLDLYITPPTWSEMVHEINRRSRDMVRHGQLTESKFESTTEATRDVLHNYLTVVPESTYSGYEAEARDRIPRDQNDWPTVALALALGSGIWTVDQDFFGCGLAVWTTQTLLTHVEAGRATQGA